MPILDRYRVYTYGSPFSYEPYRKSSSSSYETALEDYKVAKNWNYTAVLFDVEQGFLETYESWFKPQASDIRKVLDLVNTATGLPMDTLDKALGMLKTEDAPLAKAMKLALEEAKITTSFSQGE